MKITTWVASTVFKLLRRYIKTRNKNVNERLKAKVQNSEDFSSHRIFFPLLFFEPENYSVYGFIKKVFQCSPGNNILHLIRFCTQFLNALLKIWFNKIFNVFFFCSSIENISSLEHIIFQMHCLLEFPGELILCLIIYIITKTITKL